MTKNKPATRHLLPGSLILAFALTASPVAHGALIASEGFDYPDGTLAGNNGGTGDWGGAWAGGSTVSDGRNLSGTAANRPIDTTFVGSPTVPLYFSALFTKTGTDTTWATWLQLSNNSTARDNDVRIGIADGGFSARIEDAASNTETNGDFGTYTNGTTVMVVGKVDFNVSGNNDQLTVWVDPTGFETSSNTNTIGGQDIGWVTPTFALTETLALSGGDGFIDDIRIGSTWASVIPEPSTALLGGLGMLCLLRRRR